MTINIFRRKVARSFWVLAGVLLLCSLLFGQPLFAAAADGSEVSDAKMTWVCISAAFAFAVGAISAGFAISHVGTAAMGALSARPEVGSQALIFIALAEGLVVFGFITALMILGKI
ncbi:MAG: ATP synthase subunit C [Sphaerochaetaceae bacterium]